MITTLDRGWLEGEIKFCKEAWTTILVVEVKAAGLMLDLHDRVSRYKEKTS